MNKKQKKQEVLDKYDFEFSHFVNENKNHVFGYLKNLKTKERGELEWDDVFIITIPDFITFDEFEILVKEINHYIY